MSIEPEPFDHEVDRPFAEMTYENKRKQMIALESKESLAPAGKVAQNQVASMGTVEMVEKIGE
jgi:hypothetical protein